MNGLWGMAGAFIYAAPRLTICIRNCRANNSPISDCLMEFAFALATGWIAAEGGAMWLAQHLSQSQEHQVRAVAVVLGLLSNPIAPIMVAMLSGKDFLRTVLEAALKSLGGPRP